LGRQTQSRQLRRRKNASKPLEFVSSNKGRTEKRIRLKRKKMAKLEKRVPSRKEGVRTSKVAQKKKKGRSRRRNIASSSAQSTTERGDSTKIEKGYEMGRQGKEIRAQRTSCRSAQGGSGKERGRGNTCLRSASESGTSQRRTRRKRKKRGISVRSTCALTQSCGPPR